MADIFRDFDKAFAEKEKKYLIITFKKKEYKVPASMPAIIPIKMERLMEEYGKDVEIPALESYSLMTKLMKRDQLEALAEDATVEELTEILGWIMGQYGENKKEEEEEAKN